MIKQGDHVRLKDSPYEGTVTSTVSGIVTFKYGGSAITVSNPDLLEPVIDPGPGDIYEDKNGAEWIIIRSCMSPGYPEHTYAKLIDTRRPGYKHNTVFLSSPENITAWIDIYGPKLRRRRGQ
jgi:hypothetical protein